MESRLIDPLTLMYHELRAPLGLVATAARSMAEDADDDDLRSRCEMIVRAAERMLRTAEVVRNLAMHGAGPESESFCPVTVIDDLTLTLRGLGVRLAVAVETNPEVVLRGSAERFEALIHSVISNALDHGVTRAPIAIRVSATDRRLFVDVMNSVGGEDTHRGNGLGTIITTALARGFHAQVESSIEDGCHTSRVTFPRDTAKSATADEGASVRSA